MKKTVISFVALMMILILMGGEGEVARIHILANSDSSRDREVKMKVAGAVEELLREECFDSMETLEKGLRDYLPEIERRADEVLREEGFSYSARGEVGIKHFEKRGLKNASFPEGEYLTLTLTLGEGKGENFWSVMFPNVSIGASLASGEEGRGRTAVLGGGMIVKVRCLILDIFSVDKRVKKE